MNAALDALRAIVDQAHRARGIFGKSLRAWMNDELNAARAVIAAEEERQQTETQQRETDQYHARIHASEEPGQ